MKRAPIVLTSDFGLADEYVGVLKGVILSINPDASLVDLTHEIPPQDIRRAATLISRNHAYFPIGSIHLCIVDPGVGSRRRMLVVSACNQFFIGPDNGIFSAILKTEEAATVHELTNRDWFLDEISTTFHGRDIMAPAAARLSLGAPINEAGLPVPRASCVILSETLPIIGESKLVGEIESIDRFGNLITNINKAHLETFCGENNIILRIKTMAVPFHRTSYRDLPDEQPAAIVNSSKLVEISVKNGNAAELLGINCGEKVLVERL